MDADNPVYDSRDNCNAIIKTSSNKLISGCKNTVIPNSATTIGERAFYGISSLSSIAIPNNVTVIDRYAFNYCIGLSAVIIGDGVKTIGEAAFYECYDLASVTIGRTVNTIERYAFDGCNSLKDVYCFAERVPDIGKDVFSGVKLYAATLHVPATSLQAYSTTDPWSDFGQIVAIDGEGDGIGQLTSKTFTNPTVYDLSGRRTTKMQKGLNLLRNADEQVRKVLQK